MQRRNLVALAATAITAAVALLPATALAQTTAPHYYLALGDSLSQGMQPDLNGVTRNTNQGYANDLLTIEQKQDPQPAAGPARLRRRDDDQHADRPRQRRERAACCTATAPAARSCPRPSAS